MGAVETCRSPWWGSWAGGKFDLTFTFKPTETKTLFPETEIVSTFLLIYINRHDPQLISFTLCYLKLSSIWFFVFHADGFIYSSPPKFSMHIWLKRDQLDVTCFFISLFNAQHVSDVNTSILRSLRLIRWVISWVVLLWFEACWCYVVVWLGWCGIRVQAEALLQPAPGYHTTPHHPISTQVFLVFPVSISKCWDGSQHSKLPLHASHIDLSTSI